MAAAFKVLTIDGGGIRGIIPALILAAIEQQTQKRIGELFDLVAGTSTGGILALGVVKPGADNKPEMAATDLVRLYQQEGPSIFASSPLQSLHLSALRGPKYGASGLENSLRKYFGDARLKDALKPVLVPSYDIEKQVPIFFKSEKAKASADADFSMFEVARATSAAPTYFAPEKIATADPLNYYALIDGGVVAGNPAMCAFAEAVKMGRADPSGILMVSLGTGEQRHPIKYGDACNWGQLEWAQPIIDIVLQGSNATVDYQLQQLLPTASNEQKYFRCQVELSDLTSDIADASDANLKRLMDLSQDYLSHVDTRDQLDRICQQLLASQ